MRIIDCLLAHKSAPLIDFRQHKVALSPLGKVLVLNRLSPELLAHLRTESVSVLENQVNRRLL